ncbi:MAG: phosphoglucosamine mutase, partial [Elusimicrobia bacterium]|nr:phosphoglucosamine mutase [Elusimicrobiota bacterium]
GKRILKALQHGINAAGIKVTDLGVLPTPAVAYLLKNNNYQAGIVISASHNPYLDNGIKFFSSKGKKLPDKVEAKLEKHLVKYIEEKKVLSKNSKIKNVSGKNLVKQYEKFLISLMPKDALKGKTIAIDCANGASYKIAPEVLKKLKADVIVINNKPTGKNINLNCGALHPETVATVVKAKKTFCGFAFDGDADRVISVDDKGTVRDGDYFLGVVSKYLKDNNKLKNNTLVITVMANLGLIKAAKQEKIKVVTSKVGDRYVYEDLIKHKAIIGGEQSGHIIFKQLLDTGDGLISALQLLNILTKENKSLSQMCGWIKKYPQVLINEKVLEKIPLEKLPQTTKLIKQVEKKLGDNGRILVRYSGTEKLLRVMLEGQDKKEIKKTAQNVVNAAKKEIEKTVKGK